MTDDDSILLTMLDYLLTLMISSDQMLQHVTAEGTALVKQAEDAASNKKVVHLYAVFVYDIMHYILTNIQCIIDNCPAILFFSRIYMALFLYMSRIFTIVSSSVLF